MFAALIGFLFKFLVRSLRLDIRIDFFRFSNKWYYILSGEILDMDNYRFGSRDITITGVDVLCNVGSEPIIYVGQLVSYYLNKEGDLDAVLIRYPLRRKLSDDESTPEDYYSIPGDFLYIPNKDIINLNVRYFRVE